MDNNEKLILDALNILHDEGVCSYIPESDTAELFRSDGSRVKMKPEVFHKLCEAGYIQQRQTSQTRRHFDIPENFRYDLSKMGKDFYDSHKPK